MQLALDLLEAALVAALDFTHAARDALEGSRLEKSEHARAMAEAEARRLERELDSFQHTHAELREERDRARLDLAESTDAYEHLITRAWAELTGFTHKPPANVLVLLAACAKAKRDVERCTDVLLEAVYSNAPHDPNCPARDCNGPERAYEVKCACKLRVLTERIVALKLGVVRERRPTAEEVEAFIAKEGAT